jgi:transcriptional regulator with XRE-family HTH domain
VVEDHRKAVGARLRDLRKARNMSQEDAAYAVGVTLKTWGDWERGRRDPYDANWRKIGQAFDVDPAEVRGTPPPPLGLGEESAPAWAVELAGKLDALEAERAEHGDVIEGMLQRQTALLERIEALVGGAEVAQAEVSERVRQAVEEAITDFEQRVADVLERRRAQGG